MSYTTHSFSVELATKIGLREAIILQHLFWWHQHNTSIKPLNMDGKVWFYLSTAKIQEVFPYLSAQAVKTIISHLIEMGLIVKDHKGQGQEKFDRTTWYALTDRAIQLFHLRISTNGEDEINHIVNNTSYNTSTNVESNISNNTAHAKFSFRDSLRGLGVSAATVDAWMQVRKAQHAVNTEIAFQAVERELKKAAAAGHSAEDCIRLAVEKSWRGFNASWLEERPAPRTQAPARRNVTDDLLALGREMFGGQMHQYDEQ